jgi:hypothetical protein
MSDAKGEKFLVVRVAPNEARVIRFGRKGEDWEKESEHLVKDGACDCRGFGFRNTCVHLDVASQPIEGKPVPLDDAREAMHKLIRFFGPANIQMPETPFEKNAAGQVICVHVIYTGTEARVFTGLIGDAKVRLQEVPASVLAASAA